MLPLHKVRVSALIHVGYWILGDYFSFFLLSSSMPAIPCRDR
jgi:hypothetical protein